MVLLPIFAAITASAGWAAGSVLAQPPARALGIFAFTRVQLVACGAILVVLCALLGHWSTVAWQFWPHFLVSIVFGTILGNITMIACLLRAGPRRTELVMTTRGPAVAVIAFLWLGETVSGIDLAGMLVVVAGIAIAIQHGGNPASDSDRISGSLLTFVALGVASTLCQGLGFLVMKPAMQAGTEPLVASAIRVAGAAVIVAAIGLWPARFTRPLSPLTPKLLGQAVLPGVIGYVVASSLLLYAFANTHSGVASVLGSLSPVLVIFVVWLKEGRAPRPAAFLGAAVAIAGTAIIVLA